MSPVFDVHPAFASARSRNVVLLVGASILLGGALAGCMPGAGERVDRHGDEIVVAGQLFHTGTPVVLWMDPNGYDAYRARRHFEPDEIMPANPASKGDPNRYGVRKGLDEPVQQSVAENGWTLDNVQEVVQQFVIHYDVCGTSRQCFKVLQDMRGLSVQFMLDVDGTIYQTLDLKERAWHAGTANDQSIGIEIAHIGAYSDMKVLNQWYTLDKSGWPRITFPSWMTETGIRAPDFVPYAARKEVVTGTINGRKLMQYDFTNEQYRALGKLTAALARVLPKMRLDYPRDEQGHLDMNVLSPEKLEAYSGLLGHWHVTKGKVDPGPAFDWDRVLTDAQRELGLIF